MLAGTVLVLGLASNPSSGSIAPGPSQDTATLGSLMTAPAAALVFTSTSMAAVVTPTVEVGEAAGATSPAAPPTGEATVAATRTATPFPIATDTPPPPTATGTPQPIRTPTATLTPIATDTPPPPTATATPLPTPTGVPPTPDGVSRTARVPILMYHYISVPPPSADKYRVDLSVAPARFETHLAWLRDHGYHTISLSQLVYHLSLGRPLPDNPVILTFDDGYRDAYTNAFPLLKRYGFVGTFFLVTKPIDDGNVDYLTWDMVKEMHQAGMEMEPHGYRHYDLKGKGVDFLVYEIVGAKEAIEARTGETARFFAYPSGAYDRTTIAVLKSAYFWAAVTTVQGATHSNGDLFELRRVRVRGSTTPDQLSWLLSIQW